MLKACLLKGKIHLTSYGARKYRNYTGFWH